MSHGKVASYNLIGGVTQSIYQCDTDKHTVLSLNLCNRGTVATKITVGITDDESIIGNFEIIEYEAELLPKNSLLRTGILIPNGKYLTVLSSVSSVSAVAYGVVNGNTVAVDPITTLADTVTPLWVTPTSFSWPATLELEAEHPGDPIYSITSGSLPAGLSLSSTTGSITGTPVTVGNSGTPTVAAISPGGNTASRTFTITTTAAAAPTRITTGVAVVGGPTAPSAPTIGAATLLSATSVSLTFTAPASDGGAAITGYTATSSPGSITGTLAGATAGTITITGLTTGVAYTFTVTATNSIGTSAASAASNSVTPVIVIPTPQLWYKNEDIAAYGNGSSISSLTNYGSFGSGYNLNGGSSSTGWSAPSRQTQDGFAAIYFDGSSRFLRFANNSNLTFFPTSTFKQWTIFVVYKDGNGSGTFGWFGRYGADGTNGSIGMWPNGEGNFNQVHTNDGFPVNFAMSSDNSIIQRGFRWGQPGSNDGNITYWTGPPGAGTAATSWSQYGSDLLVGGIGSARTSSNNGYLYEILLYEDSLSDANISLVRTYLNGKFGV